MFISHKKGPFQSETIKNVIGISRPDQVGRFYQESLQYPSLNVRGLQSAWVGSQARTIVPDKAVATIDIRLVPEVDPDRLVTLVKEHIVSQGCYVIEGREPTEEERLTRSWIVRFDSPGDARLPFRTDINSDIGLWLTTAIKKGTGADPVKVRIMGGTVPIAPFINALEVPAVIVPLVNPDNNQHGPNNALLGQVQSQWQSKNPLSLHQCYQLVCTTDLESDIHASCPDPIR